MRGSSLRLGALLALSCLHSAVANAAPATPAQSKDRSAAAQSPSSASPAGGASNEAQVAQAQTLFNEAAELTSQGKFVDACNKLEASLELHDGAGTAFNLARCWQKIGRTASAHAMFETVLRKTTELGQTERADAAREKLLALTPKLSYLRIELSERAPGTEIRRAGEIVPESDWNKAVAVDPGEYELRVTAEGREPWSLEVKVVDPASTVSVIVPQLTNKPKPVAKKPLAKPQPKPAPVAEKSGSNLNRTIGIGAAAVGVGGIALGIVKGVQYMGLHDDAKAVCPASVNCTADEIARHDELLADSRSARNWSYVGFAVGGVALASAGYLLFIAPSGKEKPKVGRIDATPLLGPDLVGASLEGSF